MRDLLSRPQASVLIPAEQDEAGIRSGLHTMQLLYQKTGLFGIIGEILQIYKIKCFAFL